LKSKVIFKKSEEDLKALKIKSPKLQYFFLNIEESKEIKEIAGELYVHQ
jgi:hypothetical protein